MSAKTSVTQLPGFVASLRLLVEREQYSLTDIGLMFGVTREYVRQLCGRNGIATPPRGAVSGTHARVVREWDDEQHCFRPVRIGGHLTTWRLLLARERHDIRSVVREGYREHIVAAVASLKGRLCVTYSDAWQAVSGRRRAGPHAAAGMLGAWRACCSDRSIRLPEMREALTRETGVTWGGVGRNARVRNRGTFSVEHR